MKSKLSKDRAKEFAKSYTDALALPTVVEEEKEEQDSEEMKPKFLQNIKIQELQQMKDIQGLLNI